MHTLKLTKSRITIAIMHLSNLCKPSFNGLVTLLVRYSGGKCRHNVCDGKQLVEGCIKCSKRIILITPAYCLYTEAVLE